MRIRDIRVRETEEFEWRKLEKASSSILLFVCVSNNCTDDSKEKDKKLREKVGEGSGWTEERDWRIWVKKAWESFFFHFTLCVCVKQSHRWFQGKKQKKLREKVGEGDGWTEEKKREE